MDHQESNWGLRAGVMPSAELSKISEEPRQQQEDRDGSVIKLLHCCQILQTEKFEVEPIHLTPLLKSIKKTSRVLIVKRNNQDQNMNPASSKCSLNSSVGLKIEAKGQQRCKTSSLKKRFAEETQKQAQNPSRLSCRKNKPRPTIGQKKNKLSFLEEEPYANLGRKSGGRRFQQSATGSLKQEEQGKFLKPASAFLNGREKNEESTALEDSIQYVHQLMPGPGHYESTNSSLVKQKRETFGRSLRFQHPRPATAVISYSRPSKPTFNKNNELQSVSFGTGKSNPRSLIKKVQYCDWIRPHFYQQIEDNHIRENGQFNSTKERFQKEAVKYKGPDYYEKPDKWQEDTGHLPAYYFLSDVEKGLHFQTHDYSAKDKQNKSNVERVKKNHNGTGKVRKFGERRTPRQSIEKQKQPQIVQPQIETPKNSLGLKPRKPKLTRAPLTSQAFNSKQKKQFLIEEDEVFENTEQYNLLRSLYMKSTMKGHSINGWIKPTFNTKFQSKPTLFRV